MTQAEKDDLGARLEQLIGEYAAASQRSEAVVRLHGVLARVPVSDEPAALVSEEPAGTIHTTHDDDGA